MTRPPLADLVQQHAEVIRLRSELADETRKLLVMLRSLLATTSYSGRDLSLALGYSQTWVQRTLSRGRPANQPDTDVVGSSVSIRDQEPEF